MSDMSDRFNLNNFLRINIIKKSKKLFFFNRKKSIPLNNEIRPDKNIIKPVYKLLDYISLAKIFAVFAVVILHTNGRFWSFKYNFYKNYWISANIIECVFYFAVPVFVLCIGATLLDFNEKYGLIKYYRRRIFKVIIPLLSWNVILYFYRTYFLKNFPKGQISFAYLWDLYYNHRIYFIFGSFHQFLVVYMFIPLVAYIKKLNKIKIYSYCFIILVVTQSLIPYIINVFHLPLVWIYKRKVKYIIYIFPGYIIQNYKFPKLYRYIIYILGLSGLLIHIFGTQILTLRYRRINLMHKGYFNIPCILYSCSIFLFIKENAYLLFKIINKKYINKIGSLTIGPFFLHLPIIDTFHKYMKIDPYSFNYRLYGGIFVCTICLIITAILKKIPLFNYILP